MDAETFKRIEHMFLQAMHDISLGMTGFAASLRAGVPPEMVAAALEDCAEHARKHVAELSA